jgi:hypothetical protein
MDWEKVGQAFQGGANVLAGGLMDKYQRKRDIEEWEKKTDYAAGIEMRQRQALQDLQTNEINHRAFLDMKKKEFETDPELFPVWQSAQGGDENARGILDTTSEFRHYVDSGIPLTAAQVTRLIDPGASIPSGVRSRILAGHLKASNEETKRKADLEGTLARTEREKATTKKALEDTQDNSGLYGDYAIEKKVRDAAEKQKKADIESTVKEINSLNSRIMSKKAELARSLASKAQAAADSLIQELDRLSGLRDDAIVRRDDFKSEGSEEQARQKWAMEPTAKPPAQETPANVVENIALTPEDMKEIAAAKAARPDLSEEAIIRAYVAYKRKTKSPAKGLSPTAGLRER